MIHPNETKKFTSELSILFAEDHDELRINTTNILKSIFKEVESCVNGKEALEKYLQYQEQHSSSYDIVLSDIEMPLMDGIELTEKIYSYNPSQSIIILSAYDDTRYLLKLINLGIEQFIQKPIDYQELLNAFLNVAKRNIATKNEALEKEKIILSTNIFYDLNAKSIIDHNQNIYLTKYEIIFMDLLSSKVGKIFSNEEIVTHFNSLGETIDSANIRKLVSKFRKKIPVNFIESIYGIGYKLLPHYA